MYYILYDAVTRVVQNASQTVPVSTPSGQLMAVFSTWPGLADAGYTGAVPYSVFGDVAANPTQYEYVDGLVRPLPAYMLPSANGPIRNTAQTVAQLNLAKDLQRDYGASGSGQTTTGSMTAGSNVLTLAEPIDFQDGQGIVVPHAGGGPYQNGSTTALLAAPSGITIATTGTVGTGYTYTYYVVAFNARGGISGLSAAVSVTITQSALSESIYNTITVPVVAGASTYGLFGATTNPAGSQGWLGSANEGSGTSNPLVDRGAANMFALQQPSWLPDYTQIPTAGLGDFLVSSITSGAGGISLVLTDAAGSSVSGATCYHDDTAVVNLAIQDCNTQGIALFAPPGNYNTFDGIIGLTTRDYYPNTAQFIPMGATLSDFTLYGVPHATIFKLLPGSIQNVLQFGTSTNCTFEDFVVDGNWSEQVWNSAYEVQGNGLAILGTSATVESENVTVKNVQVKNTGQSGIRYGMYAIEGFPPDYLAGVKKGRITDCDVYNTHDQGIAVWVSDGVVVDGCTVDGENWAGICLTYSTNCTVTANTSRNNYWTQTQYWQDGTPHGFGVACEGGSGHSIVGNTLVDNLQAGVYIHNWFANNTPATNISVSDNTMVWTGTQTYIQNPSGVWINGDNGVTTSAILIDGNAVQDAKDTSGQGTGIYIGGQVSGVSVNCNSIIGSGQQGILVNTDGVTLTSNICNNNGNDGIKVNGGSSSLIGGSAIGNICNGNVGPGLHLNYVTGYTASGNNGNLNQSAAIQMQNVTYSTISDNVARNTQSNPGIQVIGTSTNNMVRGNQCIDTQTTHTQNNGIQEQSGASANIYEGNTFAGNTSTDIVFASGSTSVARNNPGYNPVGALTAPTVGASPWTYTNSNNVPVTLYVSGGTVTSITQYGVTTGLIAGAFALEPGQSVTVTYTAAPTVALIGA